MGREGDGVEEVTEGLKKAQRTANKQRGVMVRLRVGIPTCLKVESIEEQNLERWCHLVGALTGCVYVEAARKEAAGRPTGRKNRE